MKKIFLKISAIALGVCCMFLSVILSACNDPTPTESDSVYSAVESTEVTLSKEYINIDLYDVFVLTAIAEGEIVWTSSNPSVAKVDNGVVSAKGKGTATITATCGTGSASCLVAVKDSGNVPNFISDISSATILSASVYTVVPYVRYNGNIYTEFDITGVVVDNASVASAVWESGSLVVSAKASGVCTVTVSGTFRGFELTDISLQFTVLDSEAS